MSAIAVITATVISVVMLVLEVVFAKLLSTRHLCSILFLCTADAHAYAHFFLTDIILN